MRYPQYCQFTTGISSNIVNAFFALVRHQRHPRQHTSHLTHAGTPTTSLTLPRYPHQHATHITHVRTPPTLARYPRKHATNASTPLTQAREPHDPHQHEQHAISQTPQCLGLDMKYFTFANVSVLCKTKADPAFASY